MYRRKETNGSHAWMLGKLARHYSVFQECVVAACFEKILFRMQSQFSTPYYNAILSLPDPNFKETLLEPGKKEIEMEKTFCSALPDLVKAKLIGTSVTNLLAVIPDSKGFVELYTKDTCQEFHQLFCELLKCFFESLTTLKSLKEPDRPVLDAAVRNVAIYGEALQMMAGGVGIQRHFQIVEGELCKFHHKRTRDVLNQTEALQNAVTEEELEDVELQSVQPFFIRDGKALPMWKAAKDWLKLMVVHFDAIKIVSAHCNSALETKFTIKILLAPEPDPKMLTWKDLLRDAKYIESETKKSIRKDNPTPTTENIINFFEKNEAILGDTKGKSSIVDMKQTINQLIQASSSSEAVSPDDLTIMKSQLSNLRGGMSPDQEELTERIIGKIEELKGIGDGSSTRGLLYSIFEMLESMEASSLFIKRLRGGSALSTGDRFSGVPHCEILLAALISMADSETSPLTLSDDVRQELSVSHIISTFLSYPSHILQNVGHIIGISKPSCPVCLEVLSTLSNTFIFRGSHSTLSACTLPTWLPIDVIDGAVKTFGAQLREDLVRLVGRQDIPKLVRPKTSQSETLSLESVDGSTKELFVHRNEDDSREEYYARARESNNQKSPCIS